MADYSFTVLTTVEIGFEPDILLSYDFTQSNIVTEGLVLHLDSSEISSYPGNGSVWVDLTKRGNDATLFGSYEYDDISNSLNFSDSGYASISNNSDFNLTGDFTIEAEFSLTGTPDTTSPSAIISSWGDLGDPNNKFILFLTASNELVLQLNGESNTFTHPNTINIFEWNHVAVSRINNQIRIYLNNVSSSVINYSNPIEPILNLQIGSYSESGGQSFEGKIQKIRLYKNRGLNEFEVYQNSRSYVMETSNGTIRTGDISPDYLTSSVPGFLTGRRPRTGQVFPRGVYNK